MNVGLSLVGMGDATGNEIWRPRLRTKDRDEQGHYFKHSLSSRCLSINFQSF